MKLNEKQEEKIRIRSITMVEEIRSYVHTIAIRLVTTSELVVLGKVETND
jgi:hypothetical protein